MARVPRAENGPNAMDIVGAFAENYSVEDLDSVLERLVIQRVSNTEYVGRYFYVGDREFDAALNTFTE